MARRLRIITGLILFVFVSEHLINLSLGLHSFAMMDKWRGFFTYPWASFYGGMILAVSLATHGLLGLLSLYQRNTLSMSKTDMVQFASGLIIVPLLAPHVVAIIMARQLIPDYDPTYQSLLEFFWVQNPLEGLRQILVLVVVWIHGAIGLLTYFRLQNWWSKFGPLINPLIVIIPVAALLGFVEAGKEVISLGGGYGYGAAAPTPAAIEAFNLITLVKWTVAIGFITALAVTLTIRYLRLRGVVHYSRIEFTNGPQIDAETGATLLEMSIAHDVPHANLCRGRGRCGTCRVRIISSDNKLPVIEPIEQTTLRRIEAAKDVRLACQFKPDEGNLMVERMVVPYIAPADLTADEIDTALDNHEEQRPPVEATP